MRRVLKRGGTVGIRAADAYGTPDRVRMLTMVRLSLSAVALFTALLVATNVIQVWQLLILTFLIAPIDVTGNTTSQTMIIDTVPRAELFSANALFSAAVNLALVLGPALAGLILAHAGIAYAFFFSTAMYVCSAIAASCIEVEQRRQDKSTTTVWADLKGGIQFVRHTPILQWLVLIGLSAIGVGVWFSLVPRFAKDVLEIGATGYGSILSARGAGGLVGVVLLLAANRVERLTVVLVGSYICFTLLVTLLCAVKFHRHSNGSRLWPGYHLCLVPKYAAYGLPNIGNRRHAGASHELIFPTRAAIDFWLAGRWRIIGLDWPATRYDQRCHTRFRCTYLGLRTFHRPACAESRPLNSVTSFFGNKNSEQTSQHSVG